MATNPIDLDNEAYDRNAREMHRARRRMLRRLVEIREGRGHSQADVARAIGVDRSTISRFEAELENSNPTLDTVLRYAHAVGASVSMTAAALTATQPPETAQTRSTKVMTDIATRIAGLKPTSPNLTSREIPMSFSGIWMASADNDVDVVVPLGWGT